MRPAGKHFWLLIGLFLVQVGAMSAAYADSCLTLKPGDTNTRISVNQDEATVTIRISGPASASGDTSIYSVSSDAGVVVWTSSFVSGAIISVHRSAGVVTVCQGIEPAQALQPPSPSVPAPNPSVSSTSNTQASSASTQTQPSMKESTPRTPHASIPSTGTSAATSSSNSASAETMAGTASSADNQTSSTRQTSLAEAEKAVIDGVQQAYTTTDDQGKLASESVRLKAAQFGFSHDIAPFAVAAASSRQFLRLLSDAEEKRIDQQVATTQPSTGTSVASKGSVPWLLGFAAESGALTQTNSNNVLTFSGTPANIIKALKAKDYLASYSVGADSPLIKYLFTPLSFSVSFNVASSPESSATGNMAASSPATMTTAGADGTLAGYTLRYSIWNHRDARERRYQKTWTDFVSQKANPMLQRVNGLIVALETDPKYKSQFDTWVQGTKDAVTLGMTSDQIKQAFDARADAFRKIINGDPTLQKLVDDAAESIALYANANNDILNRITTSTAVAFEYTETRQSNLLSQPVTVAGSNSIPNLSTFNLVIEKGDSSLGRTQFTANASTTIFDSIPAGLHIGRIRDYRAVGQADIPLPEIKNVGMPVLTFSGLFLSLLEQPLGQMVLVNDVPISLKGNIWLFQSKLSLKIKNSGIKIPVSLTYTNRTELNKESDVRGSVGVTYNLDNLFASGAANSSK